ncbi:MAG: tetratricopeptide repeat protein [Clostridium sp.]|nr:tetratricopeptide repeat protein [Clostridium sp.]MCM1399281.1 tetratricopeptide repeat protein [Clostridium sp.]MCM1459769.1 tetratricopeptide repeat protein [Bacteroides sp.]
MAVTRPVLCPICGERVLKNGYCSGCGMHIEVARKAHNTSNYHYNIGYDKAVARDLSGAIESLKLSLRYNKKNVMTRNLLGLIYYEMGEVVEAISHFVMSINYEDSNNIASKYLKELKKDPSRLAFVDQMTKKYNIALGYAESGDYDLAIIQLKNVLGENPHFVKGYLLLALIYIHSENYEKAGTTLRRVLKIDKANPQAIRYLHEMGHTDENIMLMSKESIEDDGLLDDVYMEELAITSGGGLESESENDKSNIFKEFKKSKLDSTVKLGEYGEVSLARYSGAYVLLGLVIGILLLFFVIVPAQKKKIRSDNEELLKSYSEELATKNTTITELNEQIAALNIKVEELENKATMKDNSVPDYSNVKTGMSEDDIRAMIENE